MAFYILKTQTLSLLPGSCCKPSTQGGTSVTKCCPSERASSELAGLGQASAGAQCAAYHNWTGGLVFVFPVYSSRLLVP